MYNGLKLYHKSLPSQEKTENQIYSSYIDSLSFREWETVKKVWLFKLNSMSCYFSQTYLANEVGVSRKTANLYVKNKLLKKTYRPNRTCIYNVEEELLDFQRLQQLAYINERVRKLLDEFLRLMVFNETLRRVKKELPFDINYHFFKKFSENAISWAYAKYIKITGGCFPNKIKNGAAYLYRLCIIYHEEHSIPI